MDIKKTQHNSEHLTAASYVVNKSPWIFSTANMGIIFESAKQKYIFQSYSSSLTFRERFFLLSETGCSSIFDSS